MKQTVDRMSVQTAETRSARLVARRQYGPAQFVVAGVSCLTVFSLLFQPVAAWAATCNWDGDTSWDWATAANWDALPANDLTTDIANFNVAAYAVAATPRHPDAGTVNINGITIGASNGGMTLYGTSLSVGGSGITIASGAGAVTIRSPITLGASQAWVNNDNDTLTVAGAITTSGNTLTIDGTGPVALSGILSGASGALIRTGGGTLTLGAANTYTGTTTINGGTLSINSIKNVNSGSSAVGNPAVGNGTIAIGSSTTTGQLTYTGTGDTTDRVIDLAGTTFGVTLDQSGLNVPAAGTGLLKFTSALTATGPGGAKTLTLQGSTAGTGEIAAAIVDSSGGATSVTKAGTGTWTLSGVNTYTGTTTITGGTLNINSIKNVNTVSSAVGNPALGNGTISIGSAAAGFLKYTGTGDTTDRVINLAGTTFGVTLDQSGTGLLKFTSAFTATGNGNKTLTLQGSTTGTGEIAAAIVNSTGTTAITKAGSGTWTLSGANSSTGAITVSAGTLRLGDGSGNGTWSTTPTLTFNQLSATFQFAGTTTGQTQSLGALTFTAGEGTVKIDVPATSGNNQLTFASLVATAAGASGNFATPAGSPGTKVVFTTAPTVTKGVINAGTLFYNGADFANYGGGQVIAATCTDRNASLAATLGQPTRVTGSFTQGASLTVDSGIKFDSARTLTIGNGFLVTINNAANSAAGILVTGGVSVSIADAGTATGLTTGSTGTLVLRTDTSSDSLTIGAKLVNTGTSAMPVAKVGAGTVTLSAANTMTGSVYVNSGTLNLSNQLAVQSSTVTMAGGNLVFDHTVGGNAFSFAGLAAASSGTGFDIILQNNAGTPAAIALTVGGTATTSAYAGVLSGSGSLTKVGTGTLTLSGTNTYTGTTTINGGTLTLGGASSYSGKTTISSGTLSCTGDIRLRDVENNAAISCTGTTGTGLFITGAYSGSGTVTTTSSTSNNYNTSGTAAYVANEASVHFANAGSETVTYTLASLLSTSARAGAVYAEGSKTIVDVTSLTVGVNSAAFQRGLITRGGASLVFNTLEAWGTGQHPGGGNIRWILGGDGNLNNKIEFKSTTVDLGSWFSDGFTGNSNYLLIGGLNFVVHAKAAVDGGTDFNVGGSSSKAPYLNFDGTASNDTGGWTLAEGKLNVKGNGGNTSGNIQFNGNRYVNVAASAELNMDSAVVTTVAQGKTVTKKGAGTWNLGGTVNTRAYGTIVVAEGILNVTASPFNTALTVGGAGNTASARMNNVGVGGALTVSSKGEFYPSATGDTGNRTAASITLIGGTSDDFSDAAVLRFNFNGSSVDNLTTTGLFAMGTGYFKLNPNIINPVPGGTYTLVSGGSFSGTFDAGKWQIVDPPPGWSLQQSGTGLDLIVAGGTSNKWKADTNDGNWNTLGNWTTGTVPNGQGVTAEFDDGTVAASGAVSLDVAVTLGTIKFSNASNGYNIGAGSNKLTFQNDANQSPNIIVVGTQEISGAQGVEIATGNTLSTSGTGTLTISGPVRGTGNVAFGSAVTLSNTANDYSGTTVISSGTTTLTGKLTATPTITVNGRLDINTADALPGSPNVVDNGTINVNQNVWFGTLTGTASDIIIASGKTLTLGHDGAPASTVGPSISGGALVKEGDSTITIDDYLNGVFDSVTVNGGTLIHNHIYYTAQNNRPDAIRTVATVNPPNAVGTLITVNSGGTFALKPTGSTTYSYHNMTGAGTLRVMAGAAAIGPLLGDNSTFTGTYQIDDSVTTSSANPGNPATISLGSGSSFTFGSTATATIGTVSQSGASAATFAISGTGDVTVTGNMTGSLLFNKSGTGTVTLSGTANTYSGATSVSAGKLLVNGTLASPGGTVTVGNTTTLGGAGTINRAVTVANGGTLRPGGSIGKLTVAGDIDHQAGSIFAWEAKGYNNETDIGAAGTDYSQVAMTSGKFTIAGGTLGRLYFPAGEDFTGTFWDSNREWDIITGGSSSSTGSIADGDIKVFVDNSEYDGGDHEITDQGAFSIANIGPGTLRLTWTTSALSAGSGTWKNGKSDQKWSTNAGANNNWASGYPSETGNIATFDGTVINYASGVVNVDVPQTIGGLVFDRNPGYTVSGSTLTLNNGATASITVNSGSHEISTHVALSSDLTVTGEGSLRMSGEVSGASKALTKTGNGTLTLTGTHTYTGDTTVQSGTLDGTGTLSSALKVTGGTLEVTGATGMRTATGLEMTAGTTLKLAANGANCAKIVVPAGGGVTLNGATLNVTGPIAKGTYTLIENQGAGAIGGTFAGLPEGTPVTLNSVKFTITYKGLSGNDVVLKSATPGTVFELR